MTPIKVWPGQNHPLGATVTPEGVNFALFSESATGVDLCLFDHIAAPAETVRIRLTERTDGIWHCLVPELTAGQLYAFRVYGAYDPHAGHRFNDSKLLLDPYAKAITGLINWGGEMFGYEQSDAEDPDLQRDYRDDAWGMPKCVVTKDDFDWGDDKLLRIPMVDSVVYEVHVKGFSKLAPGVPEKLRGTYAGLGHEWSIDYLKKLGVTAVELLPIQQFVNDQFLLDKGLTNYWGYNSLGFFAPHSEYASAGANGEQVTEFKQMVKNLHAAGIEVILDVVYNHTGEGNQMGPTLSFRGIDNSAYYRLVGDNKRYYMDYTGTGNSMNLRHPRTLQLVIDSLRYWVEEMHVDGFRFDLASTLAREEHHYNRSSGFFDVLLQDPVLSKVKLIAEPWDVGEGGYQVGNFPVPWAEWNGKYRDCVRAYWKGDNGTIGEFAYRLTGSADLYEHNRAPYASVNLITAHDGFTLNDCVSYNDKHNEANGENNQDGHNDNRSWNCGAEGITDDPDVNKLRRRQLRNYLATLILSQGVPMIVGGDEFGRTQKGNNNAYCQDNEISWFDWNQMEWQGLLRDFTAGLIKIRREHPVFRRPKYFQGRRIRGAGVKDLMWLDVDGTEMTDENWNNGFALCLGMMVSGDTMDIRDAKGDAIKDDTFLLLFNAYHERMPYVLPGKQDVNWELLINTETEAGFLDQPASMASGDELDVCERSFCLLRLVKGTQSDAYSVSWKRQQKNQPTAPPAPRNQPGTSLRDATTVTKTTAPAPKEKPQPKEKAEAPAAKPEPAATKPEAKKEAAPAKPEKPEPPAKP